MAIIIEKTAMGRLVLHEFASTKTAEYVHARAMVANHAPDGSSAHLLLPQTRNAVLEHRAVVLDRTLGHLWHNRPPFRSE